MEREARKIKKKDKIAHKPVLRLLTRNPLLSRNKETLVELPTRKSLVKALAGKLFLVTVLTRTPC